LLNLRVRQSQRRPEGTQNAACRRIDHPVTGLVGIGQGLKDLGNALLPKEKPDEQNAENGKVHSERDAKLGVFVGGGLAIGQISHARSHVGHVVEHAGGHIVGNCKEEEKKVDEPSRKTNRKKRRKNKKKKSNFQKTENNT
jgi:hypothetical protein